jgi:glutathione S-transferase
MSSPCKFFALPYSPWSEKARWTLDHHRVPYREVEHVPMLGGPLLRLRLRSPLQRVTVPSLVSGKEVLRDSFAIAHYADRVGQGEPLLPDALHDAILAWNLRSETILEAGRALLVERVPLDRAALEEALPSAFPSFLRPRLGFLAKTGVWFLQHKYSTRQWDAQGGRERIRSELSALRDVLTGQGSTIFGRFTYADIVMAAALQVVQPVANRWVPLGPATRRAWTDSALAHEFADLLSWRDCVYQQHR